MSSASIIPLKALHAMESTGIYIVNPTRNTMLVGSISHSQNSKRLVPNESLLLQTLNECPKKPNSDGRNIHTKNVVNHTEQLTIKNIRYNLKKSLLL